MIQKNIRLPWTVECRANLKYETMVMMKKAGCRLIVVGFESADNQILKNIKKGLTVERMKQFVSFACNSGINYPEDRYRGFFYGGKVLQRRQVIHDYGVKSCNKRQG